MNGLDKVSVVRCCKNCTDRTVQPNCHMTCQKYLDQSAKQREVNKKLFYDGWRDFWSEVHRNRGSRH